MGCWRDLPGTQRAWVGIGEGMNSEDKEGGLGNGQSSGESQGAWKD